MTDLKKNYIATMCEPRIVVLYQRFVELICFLKQ